MQQLFYLSMPFYLNVIAAYGDANLCQVFKQWWHHLSDSLLLMVGHFLQFLQLWVDRRKNALQQQTAHISNQYQDIPSNYQ